MNPVGDEQLPKAADGSAVTSPAWPKGWTIGLPGHLQTARQSQLETRCPAGEVSVVDQRVYGFFEVSLSLFRSRAGVGTVAVKNM
jgi:hypothetical protein